MEERKKSTKISAQVEFGASFRPAGEQELKWKGWVKRKGIREVS